MVEDKNCLVIARQSQMISEVISQPNVDTNISPVPRLCLGPASFDRG
jgi:hypothetical protein